MDRPEHLHRPAQPEFVPGVAFEVDGDGDRIALGLGCLQVTLDRGEDEDWLGSPFIRVFAALTVIGLVGAVLFLLSDCVLAYNLFVQPIAFGRIGTMVPYYLGQLGIALSALGTPTSPATTKASSKATNATPNASSKAPKETKRA